MISCLCLVGGRASAARSPVASRRSSATLPGEAIAESGMGQGALLSVVDKRVERHKRPALAVFMRFDPGKTSPPPSGIPLNEGRGANPGDTPGLGRHRAAPAALNEGRGANPGDTGKVRA